MNGRSEYMLRFAWLFYASFGVKLILLPFKASVYHMTLDFKVFQDALLMVALGGAMVWVATDGGRRWPICVLTLLAVYWFLPTLSDARDLYRTPSVLTYVTASLMMLQELMQLGGLMFAFLDMAIKGVAQSPSQD